MAEAESTRNDWVIVFCCVKHGPAAVRHLAWGAWQVSAELIELGGRAWTPTVATSGEHSCVKGLTVFGHTRKPVVIGFLVQTGPQKRGLIQHNAHPSNLKSPKPEKPPRRPVFRDPGRPGCLNPKP